MEISIVEQKKSTTGAILTTCMVKFNLYIYGKIVKKKMFFDLPAINNKRIEDSKEFSIFTDFVNKFGKESELIFKCIMLSFKGSLYGNNTPYLIGKYKSFNPYYIMERLTEDYVTTRILKERLVCPIVRGVGGAEPLPFHRELTAYEPSNLIITSVKQASKEYKGRLEAMAVILTQAHIYEVVSPPMIDCGSKDVMYSDIQSLGEFRDWVKLIERLGSVFPFWSEKVVDGYNRINQLNSNPPTKEVQFLIELYLDRKNGDEPYLRTLVNQHTAIVSYY